ncbi:gliding motility-associated peptidyl-prolyl isomerase GldI [Olleya sp. R77988]|uniref:gliding motility-associated peptidyl-prolyl isomerase GldI n=1 Tax=Olleya sp. R77988 TaxID=3093875 RepID=UPI0037CACA27
MKHSLYLLLLIITVFGCKTPEARTPVSVKSGSTIDASIERNKALNKKETEAIKAIINAQPENKYQTSGNGFWYYYNTKAEIETKVTPKFGDIVKYTYNVKSLKGQSIYTKEELKIQNYAMDQQELFSGLREGLKLMQAGETVTFIFPSHKAYGYYGDEDRIGTSVPIICEVSVHSITKKE